MFAYCHDWFNGIQYSNLESGWKGVFECFFRYDSGWYKTLAESGYQKISSDELYCKTDPWNHQSYYAFFPLYPLATRLFGLIFGDWYLGAFILQLILSTGCFILFYELTKNVLQTREKALNATYILILFPTHLYFNAFYTEALYLLLLCGCCLAILKENWIVFVLLSSLLVITRTNGLIALFPLAVLYFEKNYGLNTIKKLLSFDYKKNFTWKWMSLFVGLIVFGFYCIFLYYNTGDFFAFSTAQKGWERSLTFPLFSLFNHGEMAVQIYSLYALILILTAIYIEIKNPFNFTPAWRILFWLTILLPLSTGTTISFQRYMSVNIPLIWIFSIILNKYCNRKYWIPILLITNLLYFEIWLKNSNFVQ